MLQHEKLYLSHLPSADRYFRSFSEVYAIRATSADCVPVHRDVMAQVCVTATNFILTTSVDGHLKFWKKQPAAPGEAGIEFVKHFRAHLTPILAVVASVDGLVAATIASDGSVGSEGGQGSVKVFDVENFGALLST